MAPGVGGRTIHGVVKSGNMPIPGAGVSASDAATKEQVNTSTDVDGSYSLRIPSDGHYTVRVQMAAFANGSQEVSLDVTHQDVQANFQLVLLSRTREPGADWDQRRANTGGARGFQNLYVFQSEAEDSTGGST
ncbi:MAG: carboxypeptidase-like regulatory domain-containing protein, partial [Candidatus Sulfotelmatobacter sp.]